MNKEALLLYAAEQDLEWNERATTEEIAELEEQLGVELPQDYKAISSVVAGSFHSRSCSAAKSSSASLFICVLP